MTKIYEYISEIPNSTPLYVDALTYENYYGYYNISKNGQVYKSKNNQNSPLSCTRDIENELNKSIFYKDRILNEKLQLPYTLDDILINVNDQVIASVYNNSMNMLYDNMLYLYSKCFIANNNMPIDFVKWAGKSKVITGWNNGTPEYEISEFEWHDPNEIAPKFFSYLENEGPSFGININLINNIRDMVAFQQNDIYYLFAITTDKDISFEDDYFADRLICFKIEYLKEVDSYNFKIIINTTYIDDKANIDTNTFDNNGIRNSQLQFSNNLTFKNLVNITSDNKRYIYVLDNMGNHIYVYDIFNIIYDDNIFKNRLLLYKIMGDDDAVGNTNTKFVNPTITRYLNDKLFVIDSGDDSIKIFDSGFNWIKTTGNKNFSVNIPVDITYDEINDCYYILTKNALIMRYDKDFQMMDKIETGILLDADEYCIKIYSSYNNSNILYILTNRNIYKKFITKLNKNIGTFLFNRFGIVRDIRDYWNYNYSNWNEYQVLWGKYDEDVVNYYKVSVKCLAFSPNSNNYDDIFIVINSRILRCREDIHYFTLFSSVYEKLDNFIADFNVYNKDSVFIKDEYVQSLTYNKSLYRFNYNIDVFYQKIGFYPIAEYDPYRNLIIKSFDYIEIDNIYDYGLKIYDTENIDINVINRIFTILYNKLDYLLNKIQTIVTNTQISLEDKVILV